MNTDAEKEVILSLLEAEQKCIPISLISKKTGIDRHAVARHLDVLEVFGKVRKIEKGRAKKYMLVSKFPISGLIDISSDLILILDTHLRLQYLNQSAGMYFKTSPTSLIGDKFGSLPFSLLSKREVVDAVTVFSFNHPEVLVLQDDNGLWFKITILGFSLLRTSDFIAIICTDISEKKQYEEELAAAQEKYAAAFYSSPDGIMMSDMETGEILEVNPSFCHMVEYPWEELIGNRSVDLHILESDAIRKMIISDTLHHKFEKTGKDLPFRKKTGEILDVAMMSNVIRIRDRACLLTVIRDISERKSSDEKIRRSKELYRLLAESIKDVVWIMDPGTYRFRYISPSVIPLLGWSPEELYEKTVAEIIISWLASDLSRVCEERVQNFLQRKKTGVTYYYDDLQLITKSGTIIWNEVISHLAFNEETGAVEMIGISRDSTEKMGIYLKLLESETNYRLITTYMKDVVWIMDPRTERFTYVSPSIFKMMGYNPDEIVGHSFVDILPSDLYQKWRRELLRTVQAFESGDDSVQYQRIEVMLSDRSGHHIPVEVSISLAAGPDRRVVHIIGVSRDIPENR